MIRENILKIKEEISLICSKCNRDSCLITIVAVSKGRTQDKIREAAASGITDIGENRVQEASTKYAPLPAVKWHLVGHLQTNKAEDAVRIFDLIHSVDSLRLAREIDKQAAGINKIQDILLQVNASGEASKFGLNPEEVARVIQELPAFKNINLKGLMTIAPLTDNPETTRPYFRLLREIKYKINQEKVLGREITILSMGMTDDFTVAIEEGANMLRLGRAIFEA
jgi:pyridoxal phosphate enzyme (YggS family)